MAPLLVYVPIQGLSLLNLTFLDFFKTSPRLLICAGKSVEAKLAILQILQFQSYSLVSNFRMCNVAPNKRMENVLMWFGVTLIPDAELLFYYVDF